MPRLLAIDWDRAELRYVLAHGSASKLTIDALGSAPIEITESGDAPAHSSTGPIGAALASALSTARAGRATTIVGLGRSQVEMLSLALPPASDDELAELVANQALRESPAITDESVLDFVPTPAPAGEPRSVSAFSITTKQLADVRAICDAAKVSPAHVVLRAYATASLFRRATTDAQAPCLVVNVLADEADLFVVSGATVTSLRTVQLPPPTDDAALRARLIAEIRRTLMVSGPNGSPTEGLSRVALIASPADVTALVEQLQSELAIAAEVIDPLSLADASHAQLPDRTGRFAPLVGMLLDETHGDSPAIDFLHPRKVKAPPDRRRMAVRAAVVVGALVLLAFVYVSNQLGDEQETLDNLRAELADLKKQSKQAAEFEKEVASIAEWDEASINWIDELRSLSQKFPPARDVVALRMSLAPSRGGGGRITFQGLARSPSVVQRLEERIRDDRHEIQIAREQEVLENSSYTWRFDSTVQIAGAKSAAASAKPVAKGSNSRRATSAKGMPQTDAGGDKAKTAEDPKSKKPADTAKPSTDAPPAEAKQPAADPPVQQPARADVTSRAEGRSP